jgi:phosphatidylinositol N-acetylglucosaminyltransferase subunit C
MEDSASEGAKDHKRWRKVLWDEQRFPDNHVDATFLASLVTNGAWAFGAGSRLRHAGIAANVRQWSLVGLVEGAATVQQQFTTVVLFATIFKHMLDQTLSVPVLLAGNVLLLGLLGVIGQVLGEPLAGALMLAGDPLSGIGRGALVVCLLLLLSPVLHTLTGSVAADSVWAISVVLGTLHLATFDYAASHTQAREMAASREQASDKTGPRLTTSVSMGGALSLNAAMGGAVMLASRLSDTWSVFALLIMATQLFAVLPVCRARTRIASYAAHAGLTAMLGVVCFSVLFVTVPNALFAWGYLASSVLIMFVAPSTLLLMQPQKLKIQGPWDEATLSTTTTQGGGGGED